MGVDGSDFERYAQLSDDHLLHEHATADAEVATLKRALHDLRQSQSTRRTAWETVSVLEGLTQAAQKRLEAARAEVRRRGLRP